MELFLSIYGNDWQYIKIQPINLTEFSQDGFEKLNFALGSNVFGKAETAMNLNELRVCSRILTLIELIEIKENLITKLSKENIGFVSKTPFFAYF